MRCDINTGILGGLLGGLVFGAMMQMMSAPTPQGGQMPMMAMVAMVLRSGSPLVGWLYHLFNSAVIGALFGWTLGSRLQTLVAGLGWGAVYGIVWWILGALILMPVFLGMMPLAPLLMEPMRPVAMGSLVGHLVYGIILGGCFVMLNRSTACAARNA
jgi:hypothetical protein